VIFDTLELHAYRVLTPKWAYQPLSGAGAAAAGGRFNRVDSPALYLALEPETALAEFSQSEPVFGPEESRRKLLPLDLTRWRYLLHHKSTSRPKAHGHRHDALVSTIEAYA
jgi:hypothetical protein